jgi:hypothetical protein
MSQPSSNDISEEVAVGVEPLERLVDTEAEKDRPLREHVRSAADQRVRLDPHAIARIDAALADVADRDVLPARLWRGLRAPAYVFATALAAVVIWAKLSPRLPESSAPRVPAQTVAATMSTMSATPSSHPLRLETGSLEVRTEREIAIVETPSARVEVAPASVVRITVESHGVRIAAQAGSAKISYYDGRTELALPAVEATPSSRAALHRNHARHDGRSSATDSHVVSEVPADSPGSAERTSLLAAMAKLRSAPAEALGLLDAHLARYPDGVTRPDAERARIAVLMRLGRKSDALNALDALDAPSTELRVMRGELRAEVQRYDEAIGDFGAVLVADEDRFAERALFDRAMTFGKLGERARMTADLERSLLLYPRGELADRVRIELRRATSEASR